MHKLVRLIGLPTLAVFLWVCIGGCVSREEPDKKGEGPTKGFKPDKVEGPKAPPLPKKDTPPSDFKG